MEALEVVAEEAKGGVAEDGRVGFDLLHEQLELFHLRRIHCRLPNRSKVWMIGFAFVLIERVKGGEDLER